MTSILESGPLVLENRDNSICYLNSALNMIYQVKGIRDFLAENELQNDEVLKELKSIFDPNQKGQKSARKLAKILKMKRGAQSSHEVLDKILQRLPPTLQTTMSLQYQKLTKCKKCGNQLSPRKKTVLSVQVELLWSRPHTLKYLLENQHTIKSCSKFAEEHRIFDFHKISDATKVLFVNVLQADPMPIKNLKSDGVLEVFGAKWVLKGAIVYIPDPDLQYDYGEQGHSISWTKHHQKWYKVSDEEIEIFETFDTSDVDMEMMVFERV